MADTMTHAADTRDAAASGPTLYPRTPLRPTPDVMARWITHPAPEGWTEPVLMEWSLTGEYWLDEHAHTEYAYVLEGCLHVEVDGVTVVAQAGDTVCVPAGCVGRYYAPEHARMLGVYGPNPEGRQARLLGFGKLEEEGSR